MTRSSKVYPLAAVTLYKAGYTLEEVGARFGVSREWIRQVLAAEGCDRRDPAATARDRETARLAKLAPGTLELWRHERLHTAEVAARMGISHPTVVRIMDGSVGAETRRAGDRQRTPRARAAAAGRRDIQRRWNAGEPVKDIAAAVGSTPGGLSVTLVRMRKAGWDLPRRGPGGRTT